MRTLSKVAAVALLLTLGISLGFGWGTVTHVYLANHMGVPYGVLNHNEIYGATLPDIFGYDFSTRGFTADYALHTSHDLLWALHSAAGGPQAKAAFWGVFSHNNINDPAYANQRGADWFAHGVYPEPGGAPDAVNGWVISQGFALLAAHSEISDYVVDLIGPNAAVYFNPLVGHILIETAGDILVRRNEDQQIGVRLALAAEKRSQEIPVVLGRVLQASGLFNLVDAKRAEAAWREQMEQYGQLFTLPEPELIAIDAQQTAGVGQMFIEQVLGIPGVQIDPSKIAEFINLAIAQIEPIFHTELMTVLGEVQTDMQNGPAIAGPIFAFLKDGETNQESTELMIPQQTPADFALEQNYPNPFNPTTNIAYAVPANGRVTLKIYNSIGQEVATLVNGEVPAGRYVTTWDAKGLASGMYICRLLTEGTVLTQKMTLLK